MHNNYAGLLASMIIHHIQLDINCHQKSDKYTSSCNITVNMLEKYEYS